MTDPRLEALRAVGAHHNDPARFHYLEILARRLPGQSAAVQRCWRTSSIRRWRATPKTRPTQLHRRATNAPPLQHLRWHN